MRMNLKVYVLGQREIGLVQRKIRKIKPEPLQPLLCVMLCVNRQPYDFLH